MVLEKRKSQSMARCAGLNGLTHTPERLVGGRKQSNSYDDVERQIDSFPCLSILALWSKSEGKRDIVNAQILHIMLLLSTRGVP